MDLVEMLLPDRSQKPPLLCSIQAPWPQMSFQLLQHFAEIKRLPDVIVHAGP
jgi:hypothetical protein